MDKNDKIAVKFTSDFGDFRAHMNIENLLNFDPNRIQYSTFSKMVKAQQDCVLQICAKGYFEKHFNFNFQVDCD